MRVPGRNIAVVLFGFALWCVYPRDRLDRPEAVHPVPAATVATVGSATSVSPAAVPIRRLEQVESYRGDEYVTGTGRVFATDPEGGSPQVLELPRLVDDGSRLDGMYVRVTSVVHDGAGATPSSNGEREYIYEPIVDVNRPCYGDGIDCSLFDNVNVYRHVDRVASEYWVDWLGVEIDFQVHAFTHLGNAGSWARGDTMVFGYGGLFLRNNALEDDIIYHEYAHVATSHLGFTVDTTSSVERRALNEGYADYFALSYIGRPDYAAWATKCPDRMECEGPEDDSEIRRLDTDPAVWNWNDGSPSVHLRYGVCTRKHVEDTKCKTSWITGDAVYVRAMIWGSTLWDIRAAVGSAIADQLVVSSLRMSNGNIFSFRTAAGAILAVDREVFGGDHTRILENIFAVRGIAPIHVSVGNEELQTPADDQFHIRAFPMPFADRLTLEFELERDGQIRIELFDVGGRLVHASELGIAGTGEQRMTIRPPHLASGIYFLRVTAGDDVSTRIVVRG